MTDAHALREIEGLKRLVRFYREQLSCKAEPYSLVQKRGARENTNQHLAFMLDKVIEFANDGKLSKANRWIGFVQGVLWHDQKYVIDDLRCHVVENLK